MHVLNITNAKTTFFQNQVRALEAEGIECSTLEVPGRNGRDDSRSVSDYLRFWPTVYREADNRYDIVHANYGLTGPMALTQRRHPVVLSLWGTDLFGPFRQVSRISATFADAVVVMSAEMAEEFDRECDVIPHGVDLDRFRPIPQDKARTAVGWDDTYHVIFPYRPERDEKNYPLARRVVDAASDALSRPVTLEVVRGVPQEEFPTYLNAADCLLLSSKWEGSPNVVKEALACNLPVVSTDVGDVAERLDGVEPSALGASEDELVRNLVRILRDGRRSNGRTVVRELSLECMARRYRRVYERVL